MERFDFAWMPSPPAMLRPGWPLPSIPLSLVWIPVPFPKGNGSPFERESCERKGYASPIGNVRRRSFAARSRLSRHRFRWNAESSSGLAPKGSFGMFNRSSTRHETVSFPVGSRGSLVQARVVETKRFSSLAEALRARPCNA